MNIEEIETQIELTVERLQDIAEKLVMAELAGYTEEDAEWLDLATEAQWLMGYKSEMERELQIRYAQQEQTNQFSNQEPAGPNPDIHQQETDSNPPFYSNVAGPNTDIHLEAKCEA